MTDDDWPDVEHCLWCRELLRNGDAIAADPIQTQVGERYMHRECAVRSVVGGINHQNGRCVCCGGTLPPDPEGIPRREAARMAYQMWIARKGNLQ